ncbi:PKD domain-containing protein [Streptomyces sp. NP160]|uniref:PKD domain-containing protein n=1 Tax=Streptomyces sp. NP160 TaxID=2586637 RepID=UPI0015D5C77B|nr:PKD domain-containing protein [Streptomyces sp. NP160]
MIAVTRRARPPRRARARRAPARAAALVVVLLVGLGVVAVAVPGTQPTAAAAACDGALGDRSVDVGCREHVPGAGSAGQGGGGGAAPSGPRYRYRYVLACDGNTLEAPGTTTCELATTQCAAPRLFYWQYRSSDGVAYDLVGTRCLTRQEATDGEAVPGLTLADFRSLPIPPQQVVLEPGNGYALVGVPLNAVAGTAPAVLATAVLGAAVSVRATPVAYTWDFGDGTVLGPTPDPGALFPALGTTHTYERGGDVLVTLTTTYAGEFTVDGGAPTAVAGTADVASPPVPLAVLTGAGALVEGVVG